MYKLILLLSLLYSSDNLAQVSACVLNSETRKPIPYVSIQVKDENVGTYTDEKGKFTINNVASGKYLVFSSVGYEESFMKAGEINDTVFLKLKIIRLSEIIILKKKESRSVKIGNTKGAIAQIKDFSIIPNIGLYSITKYFSEDKLYDEMPFLKKVMVRTFCDVKDSYFNLRFYSKGENGEPDGLLYDKNIINEVKRGDRILIFDVSKLNIILPSDGFFVGIERMIPEAEKKILEDGSIVSSKATDGPGLVVVKDNDARDTWSIFKGKWKKWSGISAAIEIEVTN